MHWMVHAALHLLAVLLVLAEIALPSGGIISLVLLVILGISWFQLISTGSDLIIWFAVGDAILIPLAVYLGFIVLRKIGIENKTELKVEDGFQVNFKYPVELVGKTAIVQAPLRPSGKIMVDGEYYEALSTGEMLENGAQVEIVSVTENKILVQRRA
jgi:membrane-bound serine protease (ClpP class)